MAYVDLSLPEFQARFGTEQACLDAVFDARWTRGFICPHCEHNDGFRLISRPRIVECALCGRQTSITAGTIFERSHVPLTNWFLVIFLFAQDKGGASATRLSKQLGINYPTMWFMLQRLRVAMATRDENLTLAGYIELDEAFFGGRTKGKGPRKGKVEVLVLVESEGKQAGNLVMKVIPSAQYEDLKSVIAKFVEAEPAGQWVRTDGWGTHHAVSTLGHRLNMNRISPEEQDKVMRCANLAISLAKRFFKGTYHHFCKIHIQRYLDEFCYRWNRRDHFSQLALHLITASVLHGPVSYQSVKQKKAAA